MTAPKGSLQAVLEILNSEHDHISSVLGTLELQAVRLKPGKIPDYHLLLEIVDYLNHYPGQYHHPREDLLFAQMLECDSAFQSKLDRLQREHESLGRDTHALLEELARVAAGRRVNRSQVFKDIEHFARSYRAHLEYESAEIFSQAEDTLTRADVAMLARKTRFIDDPLFGREVRYLYRRLNSTLHARVETTLAINTEE